MSTNTFTRPSALAPMIMSFAALAVVLGRLILVGTTRSLDEGSQRTCFSFSSCGSYP